jgi:hypothetical protein
MPLGAVDVMETTVQRWRGNVLAFLLNPVEWVPQKFSAFLTLVSSQYLYQNQSHYSFLLVLEIYLLGKYSPLYFIFLQT